MATDRNKIVQNYCLEDLKYMNPDQSEIWIAKHKVLKKNFTLKRVRYRGGPLELRMQQGIMGLQQFDAREYRLPYVANILKRLICQTCPKCHKMIKTSNNIYVVYDQFPNLSVKEYLARNNLSKHQKLTLMQQIAKTLNYFHNRAIILLYFSVQTLLIKDKNVIFFSDWSLARTVQSQDKINPVYLTNNYEGISNELKQEGKYSYWSDLYCLGTVFQKIMSSGLLQEPSSLDKKLDPLIKKLRNKNGSQRPRLEEILRNLQSGGTNEGSTKGRSPKSKQANMTSVKSISNFKIKHTMSTPENDQFSPTKLTTSNQFFSKYASFLQPTPKNSDNDCPSPGFTKSDKSVRLDSRKIIENTPPVCSSRKVQSRKSFDLTHYSSMNYSRKKKQDDKISILQIAKLINKKRNLAYFLLDLSEFVIRMGTCLELGYILLKYSLLTLNTAIDQWEKYENNKSGEKQEMLSLLISQKLKMGINLTFLRQNISEFSEDQSIKRQFDQDSQISQRLLKQKIIEFCKQMVIYCDQVLGQKIHQTRLVDCLFKTYMVLKKIEEGSYEKFWDKIYQKDLAYLSNQKYLKQQKNLGFRYLKSRIAQILRGK